MRSVKVQKSALRSILIANREKHAAGYDKAVDGYKVKALEVLDKATATLREKIEKLGRGEFVKVEHLAIAMRKPENHVRDYDRAIGMLDMSVDDVVDLTESEYREFVEDRWEWKQQTIRSWSGYNLHAVEEPEGDEND